jgi:hypothetical protein
VFRRVQPSKEQAAALKITKVEAKKANHVSRKKPIELTMQTLTKRTVLIGGAFFRLMPTNFKATSKASERFLRSKRSEHIKAIDIMAEKFSLL